MPQILAGGADRILSFYHSYTTVETVDGAVLEYTAGRPTDSDRHWHDLGPYIVEGGYNGEILPGFDNELQGRQAWTGFSSTELTRVRVDLSTILDYSTSPPSQLCPHRSKPVPWQEALRSRSSWSAKSLGGKPLNAGAHHPQRESPAGGDQRGLEFFRGSSERTYGQC